MTHSPASTPPIGHQVVRPAYVSIFRRVGYPPRPPVTSTLVAVDITGFGSRRDAVAQQHLRGRMYGHLAEAFAMTGLSWLDCYYEDRGDGALIIAPVGADGDYFLDPLAHHLAMVLRRDNRLAGEATHLRLRMAVHRGDVYRDAYGVTGAATVHLFRLLEAAAFKKAFKTARCDLAMIVSDRLYTDATERGGLVDATSYRRLRVSCKETRRVRAWLWLPPGGRSRFR